MPSSLGLYIDNNLIKYAKVSKNNEMLKVESFGIKNYEKLEETIKQIIEETYSYKIPISVNVSEEKYNYFNVFSQLSKKDMDGIIKTNFENYCYDNGLNKDSYQQKYFFAPSPESKEKIRVIHIASPKTLIARRKNQLSGYKVNNISPISVAIANLVKQDKKQNSIIVNIEENTIITKIGDNTIKDIKIVPYGAKEVLKKISEKENSYSKAYEICKNTTIYTNDAKDLQIEENEYLEDIMPTLYDIVTEVRKIINENLDTIEKVYITGTLSVINNIDIYFQEYLQNIKCEILKPYFVNNNSKINIKDYIEVNSAIALAQQDLEGIVRNVNFVKAVESPNSLSATLNKKITIPRLNEIDFADLYEKHRNLFDISSFVVVFLVIFYIVGALSLKSIFDNKNTEVQNAIADANTKIQTVQGYNNNLNSRINKYKMMISNIEKNNDKVSEDKRYKNTIPNLMNNIMTIIPKQVTLQSIENPNDTHIIIKASSRQYEQLAFFKTKIKTEGILSNVISDTGVVNDSKITVTIEGELP